MKKIVFCGMLVIMAVTAVACGVKAAAYEDKYIDVKVQSGDTLWNIAERAAKKYGDTRDTREILYYMERSNKLDGAFISPGMTITVPLKVRK